MPSILFVCTANQFRSPIAAASLLKALQSENTDGSWIVESAGTWAEAGLGAPEIAIRVAARLGLGIRGHRTRQLDESLLQQFDLIIVMEMGHKEALANEFPALRDRLFLLSEIVDEIGYDIPDPAVVSVNPYDVGSQLQTLIVNGRDKILRIARSLADKDM